MHGGHFHLQGGATTVARAKLWIASILVLLPALAWTCELQDRRLCEKRLTELISYRTAAIDYAFGNVSAGLPTRIDIKFIGTDDPDYRSLGGLLAYDPNRHQLLLPRRMLYSKTPNPLRWASYYWPYYQSAAMQKEFPVIEAIDNALWSAYLQESARASGLTWPHKDCESVEVGTRLPCEMLRGGIVEHVKEDHLRIFNSNRLDRIWPDDFVAFQKRVWRDDLEYAEVQRYGGIALVRPLVGEFGVSRVLAYIARTPFRVEDGNMHASAIRYQQQAREVLTVAKSAAAASMAMPVSLPTERQLKVDNRSSSP